MQIETLKVFRDIVETGSYSKSARLNYISQSAVSQQIKKMEMVFKTPLLKRKNSRILLTPPGRCLYESARKIIAVYEEAVEGVKKLSRQGGSEIRISSIYSAGIHMLERYVEKFAAVSPYTGINVEYKKFSNVVEDVVSGRADFGVVAGNFDLKDKNLSVLCVCHEEMLLAVNSAHRLSSRKEIRISDIEGETLITFTSDLPSRSIIDRWLGKNKARLRKIIEMNNIETIKSFVRSNRGVAVIPRFSVLNENPHNLKAIRISDFRAFRPIALIYDKHRKMKQEHKKFMDLMKKAKKEKVYG